MVITNQEIRERFDETISEDLSGICDILIDIEGRDEQVIKLEELMNETRVTTFEFVTLCKIKENIHTAFLNMLLSFIPEFIPGTYEKLGKSKDDLFLFTVIANVYGQVKTYNSKKLLENELIRYYKSESHNALYELFDGQECTDLNIVQLAIYKLSHMVIFTDM